MISIKCTYSNGEVIKTSVNGTIEEAQEYFLNQVFNIGHIEDNLQQCVKVEQI